MANRIIRIERQGASWRVTFGAHDIHIFPSRAAALASALGRACADDGREPQNIEIDVIAGDEMERTAVSADHGAVRLDWLS
jgi:hypothetical protein